jgi:DNA-directed RNA polymerase specialized sigma24 family protein
VNDPWWQTELPQTEKELRGYLARRLPSRAEDHDDLINETLLALSQWMRQHERSMVGSTLEDKRRVVAAFAKVVLRRRIADRFRLDSREWRRRVDLGGRQLTDVPEKGPPPEHSLMLRRMLEITIGILATMTKEDRDLIGFAAGEGPALTPRERQRLRRARSRISKAIVAELGAPAAELLREDK